MAAEHESADRTAEEISAAALPPAGAHARPRPRPSTTSTATCDQRESSMLRVAVPNKGVPVRGGRRDAARGRLPAAPRQPRAGAPRPRERRRVLLPAPARHRGLRRRRHARRRHHRARPAARLRRRRRGGRRARLRGVDVPVRRTGRAARRRSPTCRAAGSPPATRAWSSGTCASTASRRSVVRLDGAVETAVRLGVADVIADVVETGTHPARRRPGGLRRPDPALRGGARAARRAAERGRGRRRPGPPAAGRARGAAVRADGLRRAGRARRAGLRASPPGWSRRPSRRCTTRTGSPSGRWCRGRGPTRSWTSCTPSGAGRSSSRASTPAGCERGSRAEDAPFRPRAGAAGRDRAWPSPRPSPCVALAVADAAATGRSPSALVRPARRGRDRRRGRLRAARCSRGCGPTPGERRPRRPQPRARDRELAWAQVVAVRFGGGDPWVTLDLDDGEVLAVMAIQRADGARGEAEARRLATLVAAHTRDRRRRLSPPAASPRPSRPPCADHAIRGRSCA